MQRSNSAARSKAGECNLATEAQLWMRTFRFKLRLCCEERFPAMHVNLMKSELLNSSSDAVETRINQFDLRSSFKEDRREEWKGDNVQQHLAQQLEQSHISQQSLQIWRTREASVCQREHERFHVPQMRIISQSVLSSEYSDTCKSKCGEQ